MLVAQIEVNWAFMQQFTFKIPDSKNAKLYGINETHQIIQNVWSYKTTDHTAKVPSLFNKLPLW